MAMGQLVAGPIRLASTPRLAIRLGLPSLSAIPPKLTSAAMGFGVGGAYALALGHPALWISIGVAASLWLGKVARD